MCGVFMHRDVCRTVERDKRELRQVDLVFLIKGLLASVRIRSRLLLCQSESNCLLQ